MKNLKKILVQFLNQKILKPSIATSTKARNELTLYNELESIIPDISKQYTYNKLSENDAFFTQKLRSQHTFQINLTLKAISMLKSKTELNLADIGDSSGSHILYLNKVVKSANQRLNTISVNLDPVAIEKIKNKGLNAELCRAEELHLKNFKADIFTSFEMLEHLFDPISFMHNMAVKSQCEKFIITVPYVKCSKVGLHALRANSDDFSHAENTHIFELSPQDWKLLFKFSGWKVVFEEIYLQYPKWHPYFLTKPLWKKYDFEGFYGVILEKDLTYANKYQDWN